MAAKREEAPRQSLHCSWPLKFFERREYFDRKAENQPYVEWLRYPFRDVDNGSGMEDDEDEEEGDDEDDKDVEDGEDDEDEEDDAQQEENETGSEDQKYIDSLQVALTKYFDNVNDADEEGDKQPEGIEARSGPTGKDEEKEGACDTRGTARVFMEGMIGDEEILPYRDQVDVVAGFVEKAMDKESEKPVALLDDRKFGGTVSMRQKDYKPRRWTLTLEELRAKLSKQRFKVRLDRNDSLYRAQDEYCEAERRILFLSDLNPSAMEVVLETAPRSHALTLKNFFYKYLMGKAAIGVTIPPRGFKVFTFDLHIPFYVLIEGKELLNDSRKGYDGKPLRRSWHLPFLSGCQSELRSLASDQCLYEAQISVSITGIDHRIWTAYGSFDTFYGSNDSVQAYHEMKACTDRGDPLAADQLTINNLIWDPREYFFKVIEIRMNLVRREWRAIADKVEEDIKQSRKDDNLPLDFDDSITRQGVRKFSAWSRQMVKLLRSLISRLGDTVDAWDRFQRKDIGYFLFDDDSPTTSLFLKDLVNAVDTIFSDLKDILRKVQQLEDELCQDSPQGLHAHYNHGNHEAQLFQQKSARHIQILTVITILYLPLALASNVFSTTPGVLPFTPNFGRFILCLFLLGFLIVASIAALFKWHRFVRLIPECLRWWPRKELWDVEQGKKEA